MNTRADTADFLAKLRKHNIRVTANGEQLRLKAPDGVLSAGLQQEIRERKAEILAFLHDLQPTNGTPVVQSRHRPAQIPLSVGQAGMWVLDQLEFREVFKLPVLLGLSGPLDVDAVRRAFAEIVRRHENLRTCFIPTGGEIQQVVQEDVTIDVPIVDLQQVPTAERTRALEQAVAAALRQPLDLRTDLMIRAILFQLAPEEHVLLFFVHHIASDGWSQTILIKEFTTLYRAFHREEPSSLLPLTFQYADFALWQREWLAQNSDLLKQQLAYWRDQLAGAPPLLQLPTDHPRTPVASRQGAVAHFAIDGELLQALQQQSRQLGTTLFTTLLAAFQILVARYSGQKDIVIGVPVANRSRPELAPLIGLFFNTLPIRSDLAKNLPFVDFLAQVKQTTFDAYRHQELPFEHLVETLYPAHDLNHHPIAQLFFKLVEIPDGELTLPDLEVRYLDVKVQHTTPLDLDFNLLQTDQGIRGHCVYNSDLFEPATIERLIGHYQTLLAAICRDPSQAIYDLPLLTDTEQHQLLVSWNDTQVDYPQGQTLHQLFEAQVERSPDALAVLFDAEQKEKPTLTYRVLNQRANQVAHTLRALGVGPECLVGLCMERSLEMVIGILAILKAGGAYVPLDPSYPAERLQFMVDDAQVSVLVTQSHLLDTLPAQEIPVLCLDRDWPRIGQENTTNPHVPMRADNLAYMIYTSGSTGQPKGALNEHRGICNRLFWMQDAYRLTEQDRVLQKTPFSFDVSVWEFLWPLLNGAQLIVAQPEAHKDPTYLQAVIETYGVTTVHFVPSMLQIFLEHGVPARLTTLRRVICSGEALPFALQQRFFQSFSAELYNLYGPTEAAVDVTHWHCQRDTEMEVVPIGHPISNLQIYLLDEQLQPVPIGVAGELYIGGVGVGRGYHRRPALTAERFIAHPFAELARPELGAEASDDSSARLYRTGDLARYQPDGSIIFLGRLDHQVKFRGFRIELGEIEAALVKHAAVSKAVVVMQANQHGDQRLVAYLVAEAPFADERALALELRNFLAPQLPDYMIPARFIALPALPLSPNGKIDRKALPAPKERAEQTTPTAPPDSPLAQTLLGIWSDLLAAQEITVTDNFFALGGDSFLAIRLVARLNEMGLPLTLRQFVEQPTIAALAARFEQKSSIQTPTVVEASEPTGNIAPGAAVHESATHASANHLSANHLSEGERPQSPSTAQSTPAMTPASWTPLVPVQPHGDRPPLFFVHPVVGVVYPYYPLAHLLGNDQPFYGLQAAGLEPGQAPRTKIEAMATDYIEAMRSVQPKGPYYLGGWSFGGWVAFEIASQLQASGDPVAFLGLIDTPALTETNSLWDQLRGAWTFTGIMARYIWPYLHDYRDLALALAGPTQHGDEPSAEPMVPTGQQAPSSLWRHPAVRRALRVFMANNRATFAYSPQPYPGPVTVFRAGDQANYYGADLGWGRLSQSGVKVCTVSGNHMTLLRTPHVQRLAEQLKAQIAVATAETSSTALPLPQSVTHSTASLPPSNVQSRTGNMPDGTNNNEKRSFQDSQSLAESSSRNTQHAIYLSDTPDAPPNRAKPKPAATVAPRQGAAKQNGHIGAAASTAPTRRRPQTGAEYLQSLRDGRDVWIYGKRVEDVTVHPAFRNQCRMIARLYNALHDPATQATLTCATDSNSGGYTHPFFRASRSAEEQIAARDALAAWHRIGYGWIGRGPDYMAGLLGMLGPNADFYGPYQENARRWYKCFQEEMPYANHAIVNPPVDRHLPPDQVHDVYIHAIKETDAGLIVSGAKNVTTNAALTQYAFVGQDGGVHVRTKPFATTFLLPMNTPGVKIICRPSYEMTAGMMGTPFDYPLSSRMDENDAILIFDEVLVPWENILVYGDLEKQNQHIARTGFFPRSGLQACTRLAVKLDLIAGLLFKAVEATGVEQFRGVQVNVGEVLTWRHLFWALSDAMAHSAVDHNGVVIPKTEHMMAHRMLMGTAYPRIKEITSQLVASGLIFQPSSAFDFKSPELRPYLDKYVRGSTSTAAERIKLMKTLWDAIGTEFAGRHELYERNNLGNHEAIRLHALFHGMGTGTEEALKQFADTCLNEVDLNGWTAPDLINPDDLHKVHQWLG